MLPAERLGKYELIRHLASGGMARVYLARVNGVGGFERHVVLKTVRPERSEDQQYVTMFLDEARLVATLHHQHIAQVYEVGLAEGTYFLAMEYLHGETLRAVLEHAAARDYRIPTDFALTVICAAAAGLHHAHDRRRGDGSPLGIVHRDVSPSNVIVGYDGAIKLIDFGIAKAEARSTQTQTGFVKGKAGYMAPEQALGYAVDRRSDVFALGVVIYELTTQQRAFRAASEYEAVQRIVKGDLAPPSKLVPGYPPELEDVVMTALETDPDDRFQDADAMRRAIEMTAQHLGIALGAPAVHRVLGELFGSRPEPWLVDAADVPGEATIVDSESAPLLAMPAPPRRPPAPTLTFTGGSAGASAVARMSDGDELQTGRFVTVEPDLPPPAPARPDPLRLALGTTPPPKPRARAVTVPIRNTPPPRMIPIEQLPTMPVSVPVTVTPPPVVLPPRPPRSAIGTITSVSAITPLPRGRLGLWIMVGIFAVVAVGLLAMLATPEDDRVASRPEPAPEPAPVPAPAPAPVAAPAPVPVAAAMADPDPEIDPAAPLVTLRVTTTPDGATVVLDGTRLGTTPFVTTVPAGPREAVLKVRKRGHSARKTKVTFEEDVTWDVELRRR